MTTVSLKEIIHIGWKTAGISDCPNNGVYGLESFDLFRKISPMMEQSEKPWDYNTNRSKRIKCKKIPFIYVIYTYIYIYIYNNQIVHHNPCFNLFILHNNSFDNQGSEINKNDIF